MVGTTGAGVADWRALRAALGLSQVQMGRLLCIHEKAVVRLENGQTKRLHEASEVILRASLLDPRLIARLEAAGHPHPWPEDLAEAKMAR